MKRITKRDIIAFLLGILFTFLLDVILDWDAHVKAFKKGWHDGQKKASIEHLNE
ncbi:MAG: hypothetical protein R6V23_05715 [Bacteroidales bacterium]